MKDKDKERKVRTAPDNDDDRLDIKKSIFEVNKELREQKRKEEEARQEDLRRRLEERERKRQEAYDKRILEEKKELIRLKQGIIEESEEICEETEEPVKMSFRKKIGNFFYHNKWWLGIASVFLIITVVLVTNYLSKPHPDMVVLVICESDIIGNAPELENYLESMASDFNGNGKTEVSVYFIQMRGDGYANGNDTKLTTELNSAESVIVIGDEKFLELTDPEKELLDLDEMFPENLNIRSGRFYLKHTKFAECVGISDNDVPYDLFITVRKPRNYLYAKEEEMEETLEKDLPVLEKIISDLSE